jgi:hypothetical protein
VRQYSSTAVRQCGSAAVRHGGTAVRQYGLTAVRHSITLQFKHVIAKHMPACFWSGSSEESISFWTIRKGPARLRVNTSYLVSNQSDESDAA